MIIAWAIALAVWTAAGARVGRILAREVTPLRGAMASASVAVAVSVTILLPPVWDLLAPAAANSTAATASTATDSGAAAVVFELAWLVAAAASVAGAISVWSIVARNRMRVVTTFAYVFAALCGVLNIGGISAPTTVFQIVGFTIVTVTGLRYVAWSPLGRGISLIVVGSAIVATTELIGMFATVVVQPTTSLTTVMAQSIAAVLISAGCVWVLGETWVRSRMFLRRTRPLHTVLVSRFPEVRDATGKAATSILAASDVVAHVMDALYIQAGAGLFEQVDRALPTEPTDRADFLAPWIADPLQAPMLGTDLVMPPEGMSAKRWVGVLSTAYRRHASGTGTVSEMHREELPEVLH